MLRKIVAEDRKEEDSLEQIIEETLWEGGRKIMNNMSV